MEPGSLAYGYVTNTRIFGAKTPFCGTKYTLFRAAFNVGRISSKSSRVGSDGRTRIIRGTFVRIFLRRSWLEGRVILYSISESPATSHFIHALAQVTNPVRWATPAWMRTGRAIARRIPAITLARPRLGTQSTVFGIIRKGRGA